MTCIEPYATVDLEISSFITNEIGNTQVITYYGQNIDDLD